MAVDAAVPAVPAGITDALRALLLLRWGAAPATRQLQRWLTWVTGSDVLEPGQRLGVEFKEGGGTKTIYLPDIPGATPAEVEVRLETLLTEGMHSFDFTME